MDKYKLVITIYGMTKSVQLSKKFDDFEELVKGLNEIDVFVLMNRKEIKTRLD